MSRHAGLPGLPVVEITHLFQFSAAHRMHSDRFSPEENARIYGRCNNVSGHGHTYRFQVTIRGPIAPESGRIEPRARIEALVRERILERFDRADLNLLIPPAYGPTSTTEALALYLWKILDDLLPSGRLWRLRVEETPNNFFELDRAGMDRSADPGLGPDAGGQKASKG
jgi:6-pyruvoyltetrahydropterin/6-carboxytetrahydropterin synthase